MPELAADWRHIEEESASIKIFPWRCFWFQAADVGIGQGHLGHLHVDGRYDTHIAKNIAISAS